MPKTSSIIPFKPAVAPYLEAEWVGSYTEATTGKSTGVPNFIGTPGYVIPKIANDAGGFSATTDALCDFFKVTTNIDYKIVSNMDGVSVKFYKYPIPYMIQKTLFLHSDTLTFVNKQFGNLSKIPTNIISYKWFGTIAQDDLDIKISSNGRIDLGQKTIGGMLVVYQVESDVYQVLTHRPLLPLGWFPFDEPMVFGIFATDGTDLTTSLRIDPAK